MVELMSEAAEKVLRRAQPAWFSYARSVPQ
jgi:hypothetical protein